ncbi:hypothetical protein QT383_17210 [Stenotrophomonas rhizophila]
MDDKQEQPFAVDAELRACLNSASADLAEATQQKRQLIGKVETMQRARAAAQADANAARQKWRDKLRESDGTLTREVQKMRVAERTALSLVEEYEALEAELSSDLPRLELQAAEAAANCVGAKNAAINQAARHAYEQALVHAGRHLALAFELFNRAESAKVFVNSRATADELAREFFDRLGWHARDRFGADMGTQISAYLDLPPFDLQDVDMALANSPTQRSMLRKLVRGSEAA